MHGICVRMLNYIAIFNSTIDYPCTCSTWHVILSLIVNECLSEYNLSVFFFLLFECYRSELDKIKAFIVVCKCMCLSGHAFTTRHMCMVVIEWTIYYPAELGTVGFYQCLGICVLLKWHKWHAWSLLQQFKLFSKAYTKRILLYS